MDPKNSYLLYMLLWFHLSLLWFVSLREPSCREATAIADRSAITHHTDMPMLTRLHLLTDGVNLAPFYNLMFHNHWVLILTAVCYAKPSLLTYHSLFELLSGVYFLTLCSGAVCSQCNRLLAAGLVGCTLMHGIVMYCQRFVISFNATLFPLSQQLCVWFGDEGNPSIIAKAGRSS